MTLRQRLLNGIRSCSHGLVLALVLAPLTGCGDARRAPEPPEPLPGHPIVVYPIELWDEGIEGESIVMVHVLADGGVDSVFVATPSSYAAFDSAAVNGARAMRFRPGRSHGRRVAAWVRLPVRFGRDTIPAAPTVRDTTAGRP